MPRRPDSERSIMGLRPPHKKPQKWIGLNGVWYCEFPPAVAATRAPGGADQWRGERNFRATAPACPRGHSKRTEANHPEATFQSFLIRGRTFSLLACAEVNRIERGAARMPFSHNHGSLPPNSSHNIHCAESVSG
jgi:hypothetical protein